MIGERDKRQGPITFDPLKIIDRAVCIEAQEAFADFLSAHRQVEFGETRRLSTQHVGLILRAFDSFMRDATVPLPWAQKVNRLHQRLAKCAQAGVLDPLAARNVCFDALSYIRRLEMRVAKTTMGMALKSKLPQLHGANDP